MDRIGLSGFQWEFCKDQALGDPAAFPVGRKKRGKVRRTHLVFPGKPAGWLMCVNW